MLVFTYLPLPRLRACLRGGCCPRPLLKSFLPNVLSGRVIWQGAVAVADFVSASACPSCEIA